MKVYVIPDDSGARKAFINLGNNYLICIGTEKEVDESTPDQLAVMVQSAVATSVYNSMQAYKATKH